MKNSTTSTHSTQGSSSSTTTPKKFDDALTSYDKFNDKNATASTSGLNSDVGSDKADKTRSDYSPSSITNDWANQGSKMLKDYSKNIMTGYETVREKSGVIGKEVVQFVERRPLVSVALAAGLGVALGRFLSGPKSDRR